MIFFSFILCIWNNLKYRKLLEGAIFFLFRTIFYLYFLTTRIWWLLFLLIFLGKHSKLINSRVVFLWKLVFVHVINGMGGWVVCKKKKNWMMIDFTIFVCIMSDDNKNVWLCSMKWIFLKFAANYSTHTFWATSEINLTPHFPFFFVKADNFFSLFDVAAAVCKLRLCISKMRCCWSLFVVLVNFITKLVSII